MCAVRGLLWLLALALGAVPGPACGAQCGGAVPCSCGDVLDEHYRLPADLGPCPADGLVLRGGASLDCQGHTIRGTPGQADVAGREGSVGISLDGTINAEVRNCSVTGFRTGIEFRQAQRSTVLQSTVFRNGDVRTRVGYGIHFNRSQESAVRDSTVRENADEGIHVGSGSNDNTLIGNSVYDNGREDFYLLDVRGTQVLGNRAGGKVSATLYMKHAAASRVEANQFDDRPVVILGRSAGNVFTDNRLLGGLNFRAYRDGAKTEAPTGNVVRGGKLAASGACLTFVEASDNRIDTVAIEGCQRITAYSERPTTNYFASIPLERVPLDLAGGARFRLLARVRVEVRGAGGAPVRGVRFNLRSSTGETSEESPTDSDGAVELTVPTHVVSAGSLVTLTPVQLRLQAEGYSVLESLLSDPLPQRLALVLEPAR